ncbi:serine hydrolase domain-containing protein [Wukongibacter sp. M2B1]|uniref:serine hydrolase domain-containing protein n=1 Tax=Wukongibacter sp. M2B1 TaxID=3088895 RepID=UPI003D7BE275
MKNKILLFIGIFIWIFALDMNYVDANNNISYEESNKAISYIEQAFRKSNIPGISVVVINKDKSEYVNYGTKSLNVSDRIDKESLFELGSNSKAFTALGILYLEKKGQLSLDDPVNKYIPWFNIKGKNGYEDEESNMAGDIKIKHLLYHTSGIPFKTLGYIPPSKSKDALENTTYMLTDFNLDFSPGKEFAYVSTNYDILGLLVQKTSGESFEEFMQKSILIPLGLNNTYVLPTEITVKENITKGHKVGFLGVREYDAPFYRGNAPAGYFISNAKDMERWMRIQLGIVDIPEFYKELIQKSHQPDNSVDAHGDNFYGGGWEIHTEGKYIMHGGNNPNFSSMIVLKPESKLGVCVLANINTTYTSSIASNVINILEDKATEEVAADIFSSMDKIFTTVSIVFFVLGALFGYLIICSIYAVIKGKRNKKKRGFVGILLTSLLTVLVILFTCGLYFLPNILLGGFPWKAVRVWTPNSLFWGIILLPVMVVLLWLYILIVFHFPKYKEYPSRY